MSIRHKLSVPADHFTIIRNDWLRDERLSWKARGLVAYLASHRVGWSTSLDQLASVGKDGKDSVRAGLRELEAFGYLKVSRERNPDGTLAGTDFDLTDPWITPTSGNPAQENPAQENPTPKKNSSSEDQEEEEQTLMSTDGLVAADPFDEWYAAYPRKVAPAEARKAYKAALKRGATPEQLLAAVKAFPFPPKPKVRGVDDFRPHPASWLNRERYLDQQDAAPAQSRAERVRRQGGVTW